MTTTKNVNLGQNSFIPERFDYDREVKMTEFDPDRNPDWGQDDDDDAVLSENVDWNDIEKVQCPRCGSESLKYIGEVYDDDMCRGSGFACLDCGNHFDELSIEEDRN